MKSIMIQLTAAFTIVTLYHASKAIGYYLKRLLIKREGGVCEGVYINRLKALESRVAFLELKECDIKDFVKVEHDFGTKLKSEHDYGDRIRVDRTIFYRRPITQTNQKYYEYVQKGVYRNEDDLVYISD